MNANLGPRKLIFSYLGGLDTQRVKRDTKNQQMEPNFTNYERVISNFWQKWQAMS